MPTSLEQALQRTTCAADANKVQSVCVFDTQCAWRSRLPPVAPALPNPGGGVPITSCVPRVACARVAGAQASASDDNYDNYTLEATVIQGGTAAPVVLDGLRAPTHAAALACMRDAPQTPPPASAPSACSPSARASPSSTLLKPKDQLSVPDATAAGAVLVVDRVLADWACSTDNTPPANAPCRRVPLDLSQCPYDPTNPGRQRQYVLSFRQPHGQPAASSAATVELYCVPPAQADALFPDGGKKAVFENEFVPVGQTAPLCRALTLPGLDAHCASQENKNTPLCDTTEQIQTGCIHAFQRWNTHATTATNVQNGAAGLTSVSSPLLRNRVTDFAPMQNQVFNGVAAQTARICSDFPRGVAVKLVHENSAATTGNTGLPDLDGPTEALEPTAWTSYETPGAHTPVTVQPATQQETPLLNNLECLSNAPDQTTLKCMAFAKDTDPTSSVAVYLQNDLQCTPPPKSSAQGNEASLHAGNEALQRAYRQCMATVLCQHNTTYCNSAGNPRSPAWCAQHQDDCARCNADPLCTMQSGTCQSRCLNRDDPDVCLDPCSGTQPSSAGECSGQCKAYGGKCVDPCKYIEMSNDDGLYARQCMDYQMGCTQLQEKDACQNHGQDQGRRGMCTWVGGDAFPCVPTASRAVCQYQSTPYPQCLPANTPCQLDRQSNTDQCVPACTQYTGYSAGVASVAANACNASSLLQKMNDIVLYKLQEPATGAHADSIIGAWQQGALTMEPWRTMQLGKSSLTHQLHAQGLLDNATYAAGFRQAFTPLHDESQGTVVYLPQGDVEGMEPPAELGCNAYQVTETCAGLEYQCVPHTHLPQAQGGPVDVGGYSAAGQGETEYTRRYRAAANLRPALEVLRQPPPPSGPRSLALTLDAPPWGCAHLPMCETCCQNNVVLPCCQRGRCCSRLSGTCPGPLGA